MGLSITETNNDRAKTHSGRMASLIAESADRNNREVDRVFIWLMVVQYFCGVLLALYFTPQTWVVETAYVHLHVWMAVVFGAVVSSIPIYMALAYPGSAATRHTMAVAQAIWSALLIHLSGGRIETHFHVFGSLAFIAFYRDWKVVATMTFVVAADHAVRGIWWPLSVYGVATESPWRWVEHAAWVLMEDIVLVFYCIRGRREELQMCQRQAELEALNHEFEQKVELRTRELEAEKKNAERVALVAEHTDSAVLILDADGRTEWVNDGFTRSVGYVLQDVYQKRPYEVLAGAETDPDAIEKMKDGFDSGRGFDLLAAKHRKDGTPRVMEIEARPILNADNEVIQFVQVERDVTQRELDHAERQRMSRELEENAKHLSKLALVAQHTSNAVTITDIDGNIEWVNEGFTRTTGYLLEDVDGKSPDDILHGPLTSELTVNKIRQCIRHHRPFSGEIVHYTKEDEIYWAFLQINPARDENGRVDRFIYVVTDISERKEAEKERDRLNTELRTAAREAGRAEVATGVLHNVGNVLNSVNVSATLLQEKLSGSAVRQLKKGVAMLNSHDRGWADFLLEDQRGKHFPAFLENVSASLEEELDAELKETHALILNIAHIREIVTAQQSSAARQRIVEPIDVEELVDAAIKVNESGLERHNIQVVKQTDGLQTIVSEQHELLQILINLIKNAKEACDGCKTRRVSVSVKEKEGQASISVTDTGVGIEPEQLTNLFQYGFTTKEGGHGFGLHAAAITATELGGSLVAHSDGLGTGATFTLRIPLERTTPTPPQTPSVQSPGNKEAVLCD